jgi:histidinol-phosphate aminotransferase
MIPIDIKSFARAEIMDLPPYIPGKAIEEVKREYGLKVITKMASNENPLGPSPKAMEAMEKSIKDIHLYPEVSCLALKEKISSIFGIDIDMITFANGGDNIFTMIAQAFLNHGEEVIMAYPTFSFYRMAVRIMGANPIEVPLKDHVHDLKAMGERITSRTKLIIICNPNNPTGTIVNKIELDSFIRGLPSHVLTVLDEAYFDFTDKDLLPDSISYIKKGYPLLSVRTFSKIYGLAGIRIGYVLGRREFIDCLNRVREPFAVNRLAQVAAIGALDDQEFREKVIINNRAGRKFLEESLRDMGLETVPSHTNFILVDIKRDSRVIFEALLKRGIIVRPGYIWNLPRFIRITIGREEENERFIHALKEILNEI